MDTFATNSPALAESSVRGIWFFVVEDISLNDARFLDRLFQRRLEIHCRASHQGSAETRDPSKTKKHEAG
jgi:hypothetical protein